MNFFPVFIGSDYIYLLFGFIVLIKGADMLVSGSSNIATKLGISPLVIGLTIVAFGTSAPELFVNIFSALRGQTDLALGNVIGSNIANTWLVLGVAAMVYPLQAKSSTIYKEVPFSLIASIALLFFAFDTFISGTTENIIMRGESLVLLLFFVMFFAYTFGLAKNTKEIPEELENIGDQNMGKSLLFVFLGLIGLTLGADFLVNSARNIALSFQISETVIGLTVVALGTSAPELVTSVIASLKRQSDIAIGNVVGSNIFNILLVLGTTGSISNLTVSENIIIDIAVEIFAISLLIFFLLFIGKKGLITRIEGSIFFSLYLIYMGYLIYTQVLV